MESSGLIQGRFKLLGTLGKDEIGVTSLVEDQNSGKQVALRKFRTSIVFDELLNEALLKGFESAHALNHPNICAAHEFLEQDDNQGVLLVTEYVPGETLRDFLFKQPDHRCDEATFLGLAEQILSALEYAHKNEVIHRDLTPDNVMVTPDNVVKLIDFGVDAVVKEANFRRWDNSIFFSIDYISPEQIAGEKPSPLMDIHALGCLFYEMLAGKLPFGEHDIVHRQPDDTAEPIPDVSDLLNSLIRLCVASDKSERPQSVAEIQTALAGYESPTIPASKEDPSDTLSKEDPADALSKDDLADTLSKADPADTLSRAPSFSANAFMEEEPAEKPPAAPSAHQKAAEEARVLSQEILEETSPGKGAAPVKKTPSPGEAEPEEKATPLKEESPTEEAVPVEKAVPPGDAPLAAKPKPSLEATQLNVVDKVFEHEPVSSEEGDSEVESVPVEERVSDEDLPFTIKEKKESPMKFVLIGGFLVLIAAALWWYQSGQPSASTLVDITEEPASVQDRQVSLLEESVPEEASQQPEELAGSPSSTPGEAAPALEEQSVPTGQGSSGASLSSGYTVQVGAFDTEVRARRVLDQLSEKSYSGRIEPPPSGVEVIYRVSVGAFAGFSEASQFQTRLQADGFPTFVKRVSGP